MGKRKVKLMDIEKQHPTMDYTQLYHYICRQIEEGILAPIKASGVNGKKPALYNSYWEKQKEYLMKQKECLEIPVTINERSFRR